jgi:hypothetical protein
MQIVQYTGRRDKLTLTQRVNVINVSLRLQAHVLTSMACARAGPASARCTEPARWLGAWSGKASARAVRRPAWPRAAESYRAGH